MQRIKNDTVPHIGRVAEPTATASDRAPAFERLGGDGIRATARFLSPAELLSLRSASAQVRRDVQPLFRAVQIGARDAHWVGSLAEFERLLGEGPSTIEDPQTVLELPPDLRAGALAALGGRILSLPVHERDAAVAAFLAVPTTDDSPLLKELRDAAHFGVQGLLDRETFLVLGGRASRAVLSGGHVQQVAREFGISGTESIRELERMAISRVALSMQRHQMTVPDAARRLGVTTQEGLLALQFQAVALSGRHACDSGEHPQQVAARLGITAAAALHQLNFHAAGHAVRAGRPAEEASTEFGIHSPEERRSLLLESASTAGRGALWSGASVPEVVQRLGLAPFPEIVRVLERIAVDDIGRYYMRQGFDPFTVAQRLGIVSEDNVIALFELQDPR